MGSLESAILEIMWSADESLKPGDVLERLAIDPPVTYSTVLTILRRLWKKGLINRARDGKAFRYTPVMTKEEQIAHAMTMTFAAASDPAIALGHFVAQLSVDDTTVLQKLLRKQR